jgi:D-sedoheptulose 7-phosphate isomerase
MSHVDGFFIAAEEACRRIDKEQIQSLAVALSNLKGRLFVLGVGGSAANASHAVNDFRKLCGIEAYAPTDNVAELTARTNDEGWDTTFKTWLEVSRFNKDDALLILSVGGGTDLSSPNIANAVLFAKNLRAKIYGIVGRKIGFTQKYSDICIVIPEIVTEWVTPLSEAFQALVWHALVSHPLLQKNKTKW